MNIFAIGDIHGCLNELTSLHKKILTHDKFDVKNDLIIYLGDYIDRGKNSKEVINQILKLKNNKIKTVNLMGNHDDFMIDFLFNNKNNIENWLNFGLDQTLRSYGIEVVDFIKDGFGDDIIDQLRNTLLSTMSEEHVNFFKDLELSFSSENYLFVHAGIDPKKTLEDQTKEDFLWSRSKSFFDKDFKAQKIIVHGHTPEENIINNPHRINIDTGCYFSGKLSSVCLSDHNDSRLFINNLLK
ncbi:metallophosphoesterase [Candidatus Pelagibacter sp.]|nr:metallophosphoesterase [Candidatus Pelagibacter sp.]